MVLENVESSSDAMFNDNGSPASDVDRYSEQSTHTSPTMIQVQSPPNQILIPFDQLPRMFNVFGIPTAPRPLIPYLGVKCDAAAKLLKRPLRQDEAEALSYNMGRAMQIGSSGHALGFYTAAFLFGRGHKTYTFPGGWIPGQKEGSSLRPDKFGFLRGAAARASWQLLRAGAYMLVWQVVCRTFMSSYGFTTMLVRDASDPRLKDYNRAIRERQATNKVPVTEQSQTSMTQSETFEQRRQRRNIQENIQRRTSTQQKNFDDASPTGGSFQNDYLDMSIGGELLSDAQTAQRDKQIWPATQAEPQQVSAPTVKSQGVDVKRDAHDAMATTETTAKSSGSAWDRLRQQALDAKTKPAEKNN